MERIEYDPEGGNYQPVTEHETGSTLMVAGLIMLIAALGWMLFVGWDVRAGGGLMQAIFAVDVVLALYLITLGFIKKKRQII
jgi:energy-converting hydrogenase Eha subunit C